MNIIVIQSDSHNMKMKVRDPLGLLIFLVVCRLASARQLAVQRFIEEPRSVSVREGETVALACSVDNKMGVLQWTKGTLHLSL